MYDLTTDQVRAFQSDGFLGPLPSFSRESDIDAIRRELTNVTDQRREQPVYDRFVLRDWHLCVPSLHELFVHPAVQAAAQAALGEESLLLWRSFLFAKKAGVGEVGWHQDWGYFDGEEIGGSTPSLQPSERYMTGEKAGMAWELTVWFALTDIDADMGPLRFVRGSHRRRYPTALVPMTECGVFDQISDFFTMEDPAEIVRRASTNSLLLESVNTADFFDGVDTATLTARTAREIVIDRMSRMKAVVTLPFHIPPGDGVDVPMRKGEFVIFHERTMHGSSANTSSRDRIGVNCRITAADTLIYPQRLQGSTIDGSGLDIRRHWNVPLCGTSRNTANVYAPPARSK